MDKVAKHVDSLHKFLELGQAFFDAFHFFNELSPREAMASQPPQSDNREGGPQVSPIRAMFSIASTLVEIDDLPNREIDPKELWGEVFDSLFRGEIRDLNKCIRKLATRYVDINTKTLTDEEMKERSEKRGGGRPPKHPNQLEIYKFNHALIDELISRYVNEVLKTLLLKKKMNSIQIIYLARAIFDFYKYRFIPEWYLLGRRFMRHNAHNEGERRALRHVFFEETTRWPAITHYIIWSLQHRGEYEYASLYEYFRDKMTGKDARLAHSHITDLDYNKIIRIEDGKIAQDRSVEYYLQDYAKMITFHIGELTKTLKVRMVE